ncbi:MAG TPA: mechanosensitive ion channel family protein, partial [Gammaproteobacteria bacterium]|nr:mechanosensitive ion channel family protein [Gammaproteobacteria bacterium]
MEQYIKTLADWTGTNTWMVQVFIVVFVAMLADLVKRRLVKRLLRRLSHTHNPWDDALLQAAARPLTLLIWVVGITFAADIVRAESDAAIFNAIGPIRQVGVIIAGSWFLVRLTAGLQETVIERGLA